MENCREKKVFYSQKESRIGERLEVFLRKRKIKLLRINAIIFRNINYTTKSLAIKVRVTTKEGRKFSGCHKRRRWKGMASLYSLLYADYTYNILITGFTVNAGVINHNDTSRQLRHRYPGLVQYYRPFRLLYNLYAILEHGEPQKRRQSRPRKLFRGNATFWEWEFLWLTAHRYSLKSDYHYSRFSTCVPMSISFFFSPLFFSYTIFCYARKTPTRQM